MAILRMTAFSALLLAASAGAQTDHETRIRRLEAIEGINVCGNGVLEPDFQESCDGSDLGAKTCLDFGFDKGTLACSGSCEFDASACADNPPVPSGVLRNPYYEDPPGDVVIVRDCGSMPSTWQTFDVRTDADVLAVKAWVVGKTARVRVHWRAEPFPALQIKGGKCLSVEGVLGPNGEKPLVVAVNATRAFHPDDPIRPGGVIFQNLEVAPGKIELMVPGMGMGTNDCLGVPNDQTFFYLRDMVVSRCGHHAFVASKSAHQLVIEIARSTFDRADSHLAYIEGVAMAHVFDSTFESPGWGHALRCFARRCVIERVKVSNVQLDGTQLPVGGDNPLAPMRTYIGMAPLDLYACSQTEVRDLECTGWAERNRNGLFCVQLARSRQDLRTCDLGEVKDGEWTTLIPNTPEFNDPARWAGLEDLVTTVDGLKVTAVGPDAADSYVSDIDGFYPVFDNGQASELKIWLQANQFPTLDAMRAAVPTNHEHWTWLSGQLMPGKEQSFLKGSLTNTIPLPVPLGAWFQRSRVILKNLEYPPSIGLIRPKEIGNYCYGVAPQGSVCAEQYDGARFRQAFVEVQ